MRPGDGSLRVFRSRRSFFSGSFDEYAMPANGLVTPRVAGVDLDNVPAFLVQLDRFGEGAVDAGLDLLAVDLDSRPGLAAAGDHEDTTVGFDVLEVELGRRGVLFLAAGAARGGDAELPGRAPGSLETVRAEGGDAPLKRPFAADSQGGARPRPVLHVDDVVDEEVVARHLQRIAGGARHRRPGEDEPPGALEIHGFAVAGRQRFGARRQRLGLGEQVAGLHHLLQRPDLAFQAALRRQLHAAAVGSEAALAGLLVDGDEGLRLLAHPRRRPGRAHAAGLLVGAEVDPAVLHLDRLLRRAAGVRVAGGDDELGVGPHRVEAAVEEHDLGGAAVGGAHVVAGLELDAAARFLPVAAVAAPVLHVPLERDEPRLALRAAQRQ